MTKSKIDQIYEIEGFETYSDLAKALDVDTPAITNWRKRGVSKSAAAKIKKKFGYTTDSLLDESVPLSKGLLDTDSSPFSETDDDALQEQIDAFVDTLSDEACSAFLKALGKRFAKSTSSP